MKLKKEFIIYNTREESMLVPGGRAQFSGLVKGNETFGAILKHLSEEISEQDLIRAMCEEYDAPAEKITEDVRKAITILRDIGALDE